MSIVKIHAREIFDSRGNPTVEVDLHTDKGRNQYNIIKYIATVLCHISGWPYHHSYVLSLLLWTFHRLVQGSCTQRSIYRNLRGLGAQGQWQVPLPWKRCVCQCRVCLFNQMEFIKWPMWFWYSPPNKHFLLPLLFANLKEKYYIFVYLFLCLFVLARYQKLSEFPLPVSLSKARICSFLGRKCMTVLNEWTHWMLLANN